MGERIGIAVPGGSGTSGTYGSAIYGDLSDGTAVCDGSTAVAGMSRSGNVYTLSRDCSYASLTVNNGITVMGSAYRLAGTALVNNGTISGLAPNNGATGGNGGAGITPAGGGSPIIGNITGGAAGANGGTGNGANGGSVSSPSLGGAGGAGGTGVTTTAGTGGSAPAGNSYGTFHNGFNALGPFLNSGNALRGQANAYGGAGGGAGGGDATNNGGGGGSGGIPVWVAFKTITGTGTITAPGGNGGNGAVASTLGAGGGGGGGGGWVVVISSSVIANAIAGQTITAPGGAGGTHSGATATDGAQGAAGNIYLIPN